MELKYVDYTYDGVAVNTVAGSEADPATALSLSAIAQGDTETTRDGRKVVLKSYDIRGQVRIDSIASEVTIEIPNFIRVLLVLDKQTNGAQFNSEDVLEDTTNYDGLSHRNLQYERRFKVLKDQTWILKPHPGGLNGAGSAQVTGGDVAVFHWTGNFTLPVNYSGDTAVVASIVDQSLHMICIGSQNNGALQYKSRVRFVG